MSSPIPFPEEIAKHAEANGITISQSLVRLTKALQEKRGHYLWILSPQGCIKDWEDVAHLVLDTKDDGKLKEDLQEEFGDYFLVSIHRDGRKEW